MALKCSSTILISFEFLLLAYISVDLYVSIFLDMNKLFLSLEDNLNGKNEDPKIVEIGNFAVDEYNKLSNNHLKLQSIVKATSVESGYVLLIQVTDRKSVV